MMSTVDYAAIQIAISDKHVRIGFEPLTEAEKVINLCSWAAFEIEMGGIETYYYNSSGEYAVETVWALQKLGAPKAANILRKANELFPDSAPPKDRKARQDAISEITRASEPNPLWTITTTFYDEAGDIFGLIYRFIDKHIDQLPDDIVRQQ